MRKLAHELVDKMPFDDLNLLFKFEVIGVLPGAVIVRPLTAREILLEQRDTVIFTAESREI